MVKAGFGRVSEYVCESVCGKTAAHVEKVGEEKEMSGRQGEGEEEEVGCGRVRGKRRGREEVEKSRGTRTKEGERWK